MGTRAYNLAAQAATCPSAGGLQMGGTPSVGSHARNQPLPANVTTHSVSRSAWPMLLRTAQAAPDRTLAAVAHQEARSFGIAPFLRRAIRPVVLNTGTQGFTTTLSHLVGVQVGVQNPSAKVVRQRPSVRELLCWPLRVLRPTVVVYTQLELVFSSVQYV